MLGGTQKGAPGSGDRLTLEVWLGNLGEKISLPPPHLRNEDSVDALVNQAMSTIRQDYVKARRTAAHAEKLARSLGTASALGKAARIRGHVELLSGRSKAALKFYERAWVNFEADPLQQATTAVAMIQALAYVGQYERAFEVADHAITAFQDAGDAFRAARIIANVGNVLHRMDRYAEAEERYRAAMPVLAENSAVQDLAIVMRNYGVCLMGMRKYSEADAMYQQARGVFEEAEQSTLILEIDLNRAYLLGRQGLTFQSLTAYRDLNAALPSDAPFEIGHCLLDQADFMLEAGLYTDSIRACQTAATIFERLEAKFELGKVKLIEAQGHLQLGHLRLAEECFSVARPLIRKDSSANWMALLHSLQSQLLQNRGKPKDAYLQLRLAEEVGPAEERLALIRHRRIALAIDIGEYEFAESKLAETPILALEARLHRHRGEHALAEDRAQEALEEYDQLRTGLGSVGLRRSIASAQRELLLEVYRSLRSPEARLACVARIKDQALAEMIASPEIHRKPLPPQSDEASMSALLREEVTLTPHLALRPFQLPQAAPDQRFVEFFEVDGKLAAFAVDSDGVEEFDLGRAEDFWECAQGFHFHRLRDSESGRRLCAGALSALSSLLEPVLADCPSRLVVGRDGALMSVPFHALSCGEDFLSDRCFVSYVPNCGTATALPEVNRVSFHRAAILGSPDALAPQIEIETKLVSELIGTEPLRTLAEFASSASDARLLHIAAHGVVREDEPMFSAMRIGDERWTVLNVLQSRFNAELATLSGCSTGISILGESRDTQGFVEGLLASGCHSVLASLWDVGDAPTAHWMAEFYGSLRSNSLASAHRAACQSTRAEWPNVGDWAPFAIFGVLA